MTLDVDTSALLERSIEEAERSACEALLDVEPDAVTARRTVVEARRGGDAIERCAARDHARALRAGLGPVPGGRARRCAAATTAERPGVRTLDARHIAAATTEQAPVVSYDGRLTSAAEAEGLEVIAPRNPRQ